MEDIMQERFEPGERRAGGHEVMVTWMLAAVIWSASMAAIATFF
jgi:hypothetical protein